MQYLIKYRKEFRYNNGKYIQILSKSVSMSTKINKALTTIKYRKNSPIEKNKDPKLINVSDKDAKNKISNTIMIIEANEGTIELLSKLIGKQYYISKLSEENK